jgi:ligand-binding sensor domain-containing protein
VQNKCKECCEPDIYNIVIKKRVMEKNILKLTVLAIIAIYLFSCKKEFIAPTAITITTKSLSLNIRETDTIKATITPSNASGGIAWSSSNAAIASVNHLGIVTGVATGRVVITATAADANIKDSCGVTVSRWVTHNQLVEDVTSIVIDAQGNKWFGTYHGLWKFDGTNWTNYNYNNSKLTEAGINSATIDVQGIIWLGTFRGVFRFDGANFTNYNESNSGLSNNYVGGIAMDAQRNIWFGNNGSTSEFDGTNWKTYQMNNWINGTYLVTNRVNAIAIDANGNKWFGTENGVLTFDGTYWNDYYFENNWVNAIAIDARDNKWFGNQWGGLTKFDGVNWTTYQNSSLYNVNAIAIDAQDNKWFGTENGELTKFDGTNWSTTYLDYYPIKAIAVDPQGNIWVGTTGRIGVLELLNQK